MTCGWMSVHNSPGQKVQRDIYLKNVNNHVNDNYPR